MQKVLFAGLASAALAAPQSSTINKVISLIDELKGKVQSDLAAETKLMEEYEKWCDTTQTTTSYAIKDESRIIEEQSAHVESNGAKIEEEQAKIEELGPAIAHKEQEKAGATTQREETHKLFLEKEKELVDAEDMLRRAHGVLKRHMTSGLSFAQGGQAKMQEIVKALGAIVEATAPLGVSRGSMKEVRAFMETTDELSMNLKAAPQAQTSAYESKSGTILQAIDNMRDEVTENLRGARKEETSSRHAYEQTEQSLTNQIATFTSQLEAATANKAAAESAKGKAEETLKETQVMLADDQEYLGTTTSDCHSKSESWQGRQTSADEEMRALQEARDVLSSKVVVLAQTGSSTRRSQEESDRRDKVVTLLRGLGRKFNSFGLLQAASSASADPFEKVRALIRDMISKLEQQARDEADHKEMCDTELKKNRAKKANKLAQLRKYNTRYDAANARSQKLKSEVKDLQQQLKDLAKLVKEQTALRNQEHADNTQVIADNKASSAAVAEAIVVLRKFYGEKVEAIGGTGYGLVQTDREAAPSFDFQAKRNDASHSIIAILETAQSDFTKEYQKTEEEEREADANYKKSMQEAEVTKAKKNAAILGKDSEIKSLAVQISQTNDDISGTESELKSVQDVLDTLEQQCANKAMSFEERKTRREAELAGLQEALEILAADNGESFLQKARRVRQ